jgi:hypothetical protein
MGSLVNSLWGRYALGYGHGAKAPLGALRFELPTPILAF